jgi:hypothetical protein
LLLQHLLVKNSRIQKPFVKHNTFLLQVKYYLQVNFHLLKRRTIEYSSQLQINLLPLVMKLNKKIGEMRKVRTLFHKV